MPQANLSLIPPLAGLRPDVILVDQRAEMEFEVLPNGSRKLVKPDDKRVPLCVVDLKNITEANASYSAEVFIRMMEGLSGAQAERRTLMIDATYLKAHRTASSLAVKKGVLGGSSDAPKAA